MYRESQLTSLLAGRRILIAGYGREGRSTERLLQRLLPQACYSVATQVADKKWLAPDGGWHTGWPFDLVIKSPGIPTFHLPDAPFQLTSLTDLFLQVYGDLTVGVTGTKGKSTTATLIHHLLPGSILAGNIGVPLFDVIDGLRADSLVVAELSCHQLEVLHRGPHIGVLLNLYQEHLDHYADYRAYKMAKMQIALRQQKGDHFFFCSDNDELHRMVKQVEGALVGMVHPYSVSTLSDDERMTLEVCPLAGDHNRSNALVACRVASLVAQQPVSALRPLLASFKGLRHRLERVGVYGGITWYDDSISTIPEATIAAVKALGRVDTLILGGFDRGIDYQPLADFLTRRPVENLVFVGKAGRRLHSILPPSVASRVLLEDDYSKIVSWCADVTPKGGAVLLSPAAASYDAFKNFEERGDAFAALAASRAR